MAKSTAKTGKPVFLMLIFFLCTWIALVIVYPEVSSQSKNNQKSSVSSIIQSMERGINEKMQGLVNDPIPDYNKAIHFFNETDIEKGNIKFRTLMKQRYDIFQSRIGKDNVEKGDKYFIYRCESYCGGWSDRIKGMLTAYVIANITGRKFKSEFKDNGCNILDYIVPNLVNWSLPTSFNQSLPRYQTKTLKAVDDMRFYKSFSKQDFNKHPTMQSDFVYFKGNLENFDGLKVSKFHQSHVSWMSNLASDQITEILFKRLIKLSPKLQIKLDEFLNKIVPNPGEKLVCAHVRLGQNPTLPNDSQIFGNPKDLPAVWKFLDQQARRENTSILFFSDSQNVVEEARRKPFAKKMGSIPGNIIHIDKAKMFSKEQICKAQEKLVLEQFIMMHCDVLMISKGGFSRLPAYMRGSDRGLFCWVKGEVIPCKRQDIKRIYNQYY